eukprot:CAMPEP_0175368278 /NCGR_PEP_ID=MMETSP0095-20121207/20099_1 /TAXON_ID=311494 /ORGANISM="Alexandrium monilatum, Strain CCMP3105" /LENGTH=259 /DNA_ID=CAMNT_0016666369 /DNA_START=101 /DNA_END=877 /DNA_ORIENTATION=-
MACECHAPSRHEFLACRKSPPQHHAVVPSVDAQCKPRRYENEDDHHDNDVGRRQRRCEVLATRVWLLARTRERAHLREVATTEDLSPVLAVNSHEQDLLAVAAPENLARGVARGLDVRVRMPERRHERQQGNPVEERAGHVGATEAAHQGAVRPRRPKEPACRQQQADDEVKRRGTHGMRAKAALARKERSDTTWMPTISVAITTEETTTRLTCRRVSSSANSWPIQIVREELASPSQRILAWAGPTHAACDPPLPHPG